MKTLLCLLLCLVLISCDATPYPNVETTPPPPQPFITGSTFMVNIDNVVFGRVHDDEKHVTCWTMKGGTGVSLSCLPDYMIARGGR